MSLTEVILCVCLSLVFFLASFIGMFYPEAKEKGTPKEKAAVIFRRTALQWLYIAAAFLLIIASGIFLAKVVKITDLIYCLKRTFIISVLFVAAYHDRKDFRIPNKLILYALGVRAIFLLPEFILNNEIFKETVLSDLIAGGFMLIILFAASFIMKNGIGMGDIKLFTVIGLFQGISGTMSSVLTSLIVSFVFAVILLITKKKKKNDSIAFAPYILCGTVLSILLTGA